MGVGIVFVLIISGIILYFLNRYLFRKLINHRFNRKITMATMIMLPVVYMISYGFNKFAPSDIYATMAFASSFWFAIIVYVFLFTLLDELAKLVLTKLLKNKQSVQDFISTEKFKNIASRRYQVLIFAIIPLILAYGYRNSQCTVVVDKEIVLNENATDSLNFVFISDTHIGGTYQDKFIAKTAEKINALNPEIILIGGDLLDGDVEYTFYKGFLKAFSKLKSRYGTFAVTGNHEYIGGLFESLITISSSKSIKVLQDQYILVDNRFFVVGRKDKIAEKKEGRASLKNLMPNNPENKPVILLDHQPYNLHEAQENGVDLQLSGHTHHGQFFPANLVTKLIYELSWGHLKKGDTHYLVSCGVGTWGPPVRIGSRSEILNIKLKW